MSTEETLAHCLETLEAVSERGQYTTLEKPHLSHGDWISVVLFNMFVSRKILYIENNCRLLASSGDLLIKDRNKLKK